MTTPNASAYERVPTWQVKTFVLKGNDLLSLASARDELVNEFMRGKEVYKHKSSVVQLEDKRGKPILALVDVVTFVD